MPASQGFTEEVKRDVLNYLQEGANIQLDPLVVPDQCAFRVCKNLPTARGLEREVKLLEDFQKEVV